MACRLLKGDALKGLRKLHPCNTQKKTIKKIIMQMQLKPSPPMSSPSEPSDCRNNTCRRFLHKPMSMTTREFVTRVQQMNDYLQFFPLLQMNRSYQKMSYLTFLSSQSQVPGRQNSSGLGYDPMTGDLKKFINHCE